MAGHADVVDGLALEATARFKADLARLLERVKGYLTELLGRAHLEGGRLVEDAFNAELAAKLGKEFGATLSELGYDSALAELLDGFDALIEANSAYIDDRLGASFSSPNLRALARLAQGTVDDLLDRGDAIGGRLREIVLVGASSNAPVADLVQDLAAAAGVTLNQAVTEAQTALMAFHRDALATESQAAGIDLFTYDGPDDEVDRPFCALLVGHIVTLQDLDEMDNGENQPKPVSRFLGGYRCRHSLSPISLEEALAMVESEGAEVIGRGCRLARSILLKGKEGPAAAAFLERNLGEVRQGRVVRRRKVA